MKKLLVLLVLSFPVHAADVYVMNNGPAGHIRLTDGPCGMFFNTPEGMTPHEAIGTQFEGSADEVRTVGCWVLSRPDYIQAEDRNSRAEAAITILSEFGIAAFLESDFIKVSGE